MFNLSILAQAQNINLPNWLPYIAFSLLLVLWIWWEIFCNKLDNAERYDEIIFWSLLDWTP